MIQLGRVRFEYRPAVEPEAEAPPELVDAIDSTLVLSPEVKSLEDELMEEDQEETAPSLSSVRVAAQEPHPRTKANVEVAQAEPESSRRRRAESDSWLWWLAAGFIILLAVGYSVL